MGFRAGAYATVWDVQPISPSITKCRISISKKDKNDGSKYVQDFGGYVSFCGTNTAERALKLHERDRIKLGDVDVRSTYNKEKNVTYYNFSVFSFEPVSYGSSYGGGNSGYSYGYEQTPPDSDGFLDDSNLPY